MRKKLSATELCSPPDNRSDVATRLPSLLRHEGEWPDWDNYLTSVYGHLPPHAYPIDMSAFTWLYHSVPLDVSPARLGPRCSARHGHAWVGPHSARWPESVPALVRAGMFVQRWDPEAPDAYPLRDGVRNNSWVEVMRVRWGHAAEKHGAFYWLARGSGVWLNVGRTLVDAPGQGEQYWFRSAERLRWLQARGFDTIQFPTSVSNARSPMPNSRFELVDLRSGSGGLGGSEPVLCPGRKYLAGWAASRSCKCDPGGSVLNCGRAAIARLGLGLVEPTGKPAARAAPVRASLSHAPALSE